VHNNWLDNFDFSWPIFGLTEDVRPALADAREAGRVVALATLIDADGPSMCPIGSNMIVDPGKNRIVGFLSGGCVEGVVARCALQTLGDGKPQRLAFGRGSPYFDVKLTCGSRIEIWVERLRADDWATTVLLEGWQARRPVCWSVDLNTGVRECREIMHAKPVESKPNLSGHFFRMTWLPTPKVVIAGADPVALAVADLGLRAGWDVVLHRPRGPANIAGGCGAVRYWNGDADRLFASETIDPWTAIVCANHDMELDHAVLVHALTGPAFYIGALGSRAKVAERRQRLIACNLSLAQLQRLHAPIGCQIGAKTPHEIAVAIWADLIRTRRNG
jgi:xanthine dehydrogenase accessory factor